MLVLVQVEKETSILFKTVKHMKKKKTFLGGALLQHFNRDTQKCAYKTCLAIINGQEVSVAQFQNYPLIENSRFF